MAKKEENKLETVVSQVIVPQNSIPVIFFGDAEQAKKLQNNIGDGYAVEAIADPPTQEAFINAIKNSTHDNTAIFLNPNYNALLLKKETLDLCVRALNYADLSAPLNNKQAAVTFKKMEDGLFLAGYFVLSGQLLAIKSLKDVKSHNIVLKNTYINDMVAQITLQLPMKKMVYVQDTFVLEPGAKKGGCKTC